MSQQQVAERLSVKATALSNWENNARAISIDIEQIDKALEARGVLAGLLWASGTPDGLDADHLWTKVFPGEATPVWMWIRSPAAKVHLVGEWGVARVDQEWELGPNGLFMTVAMSIAESPVIVLLSEPGWADFGRGELPHEMPGAPVYAAINHASPSSGSGTFYEMFFSNLADRFSRSRSRDLAKLNRSAPRSLASFFNSFGRLDRTSEPQPWPPVPSEPTADDRRRFARLRRARRLSLVDASNRLAELTGVEVSKDTLRRFETDIGEPHDRLLPAALDEMLGADGHLAMQEIRSDRGPGAVRFPAFWHGPVWFEFSSPRRDIHVTFHWGDWVREVSGPSPMRLGYHYCDGTSALRISVESDVAWKVGLGRRSGAVPINTGWSPASVDVQHRAMSETELAILASLEQGKDELIDDDDPEDAADGDDHDESDESDDE